MLISHDLLFPICIREQLRDPMNYRNLVSPAGLVLEADMGDRAADQGRL